MNNNRTTSTKTAVEDRRVGQRGELFIGQHRRSQLIRIYLSVAFGLFCLIPNVFAASNVARVVVNKKRLVAGKPPVLVYPPIISLAIASAGYAQLADYGTKTVFEGPSATSAGLISSLSSVGYEARVATDLDRVAFHGFNIDPDSGVVSPPVDTAYTPTGNSGIYLVVLKAYPTPEWLDDLDSRRVRIYQELPPAAYIIRCARTVAAALRSAAYIRAVLPLLPSLKKVGFESPVETPPYRRVVVHAAIETPPESLRPFLESVARGQSVLESTARLATRYEAEVTDLDANSLTFFENAFEIAAVPVSHPSSERQAQLVAQSGSKATLPAINSHTYGEFLADHGFPSSANAFDNTRVGIIDTGFDNGDITYSGMHPDFKFDFGGPQRIVDNNDLTEWGFKEDRDHHGTLVTSIIAGYPSASSGRAEQPSNYRFGLGLAPTVRCVVYKKFSCGTAGGPAVDTEIAALAQSPYSANVINMSFNDGPDGGCAYAVNSKSVDDRTRSNSVLAVVAAGNSPEGCSFGNYVRSPATAKNALAVGSSDNYTIQFGATDAQDNPITSNTCAWNSHPLLQAPPHSQDATRLPDYSAGRQNFSFPVKPDLVAPSTRVTGPLARQQAGCASPLCNPNVACFPCPPDPNALIYGTSAGTSFAAPVVSGAAAVVRRWYKNLLGGDPSPAMVKAMLINGARDLGPFPPAVPGAKRRNQSYVETLAIGNIPDLWQGWGMVSFDRLLGPLGSYYFYDQGAQVQTSALWQKYLYIVDGSRDTHVTLVWTDVSGSVSPPGATYGVINDLDLLVTDATGSNTWYGNQLSGGYSVLNPNPQLDRVNNVEQVIIPAGTFSSGAGMILGVNPYSVPSGGQDFAVFIDNATEPATSLNPVTPCRVVDTRFPNGQYGSPSLSANTVRTFTMAGVGVCGIPASAKAIVLNVAVVGPTVWGTLRMYPGGVVAPVTGVNYYSAGQIRANNSIVALGGSGAMSVRADQGSGTVDVIIDVVGYYQ